MRQRIMLSFYGLIIAMAVFSTHAGAVSLGKIDVASHLGEPFYAEVPLTLDEGEVITTVTVELAEPTDYRILEVYRDRALQLVRADVESDSRGNRVEISSRNVIDAPFFNLVLKVRQGRATHFKKYPVFLDLPRAAAPVKEAAPVPSVSVDRVASQAEEPTVTAIQSMPAEVSEPAAEEAQTPAPFTPHDQWARASHYGPMVYGDTVSTVADRLRLDARYSRNQVMVALFEKNRSKFDNDNINLIQAGTHLDVPMADEVERIAPDQALSIMKEHNQRWRELVKQPRYAAIKEAQETRYSKRVRVGKSATGVAASPVSKPGSGEAPVDESATATMASDGSEEGMMAADENAAESEVTTALTASVAMLQKENEELQAKLAESETNLAKLSAGGVADAQAAADVRIKKLELQLARLHAELDSARQREAEGSAFGWLVYLLGGLVVVLLGGIAFLMRRERQHPAQLAANETYPDDFADSAAVPAEVPEIDVEAVEELPGDSADQGEMDEFDDAFTDSIPDLTEDETGEMEAFETDQEEDPDPNVDYLSEADVYMRYGMEDEAEKQVEMALKLNETNQDAHAKLVQVRKAKGDESGADEALGTARMVLGGEALNNFEATMSGMASDLSGEDAGDAGLDDTLPPGALDVSDMESEAPFSEAAGDQDESTGLDDIDLDSEAGIEEQPAAEDVAEAIEDDDLEFDLSGLETPDEVDSEPETEAVAEEAPAEDVAEAAADDDLEFDLSGLELPDDDGSEPVAEAVAEDALAEDVAEASAEAEETDSLDFDLSGLELPDEDASEPEAVEQEPVAEQEEPEVAEEEPEFESAESVDDDNGLNLSEFDLSDEMMESASEETSQVDALDELGTADLDKTVVMNWSKETMASGGKDVGGESGADEFGFADDESPAEEPVTDEPAEEPVTEESQDGNEPEENLSGMDLNLEDLDIDLDVDLDLDESMDSGEMDDFSSTIQSSIDKIEEEVVTDPGGLSGAENSAADDLQTDVADADESFDFDFESVDEAEPESVDGEISADGLGEVSLDDLSGSGSLEDLLEDSDKDFDATMELDSLLSELGGADEPTSDKKEDGDKES